MYLTQKKSLKNTHRLQCSCHQLFQFIQTLVDPGSSFSLQHRFHHFPILISSRDRFHWHRIDDKVLMMVMVWRHFANSLKTATHHNTRFICYGNDFQRERLTIKWEPKVLLSTYFVFAFGNVRRQHTEASKRAKSVGKKTTKKCCPIG